MRYDTSCIYCIIVVAIYFAIIATNYIAGEIHITVYAQQGLQNNSLSQNSNNTSDISKEHLGINMRGYYTSMPQSRDFKFQFPDNYYDSSFRDIAKSQVIDHLRYRFYWESYVRNSSAFLKEIEDVANTADKFGLKVIYDNHQFHTSSWMNPNRGTGFPAYLFADTKLYPQDSGGMPKSPAAQTWWTNWWNRAIKGTNGTDGWTLQLDFLKKIVSTVDKHPSTLGYEILSEPQVHSVDQWSKIGKYNSFMTDELRKLTDKAIVYSMNIPIDLKSPIKVNAENLAKMTPAKKENVVFKFSLYGIPSDGYQGDKLDLFENTSKLSGIPLYIGEWNNVKRVPTFENGKTVWTIDETLSDINQAQANKIVNEFKRIGVWGAAFWEWSFVPNDTPNFNLANVTSDKITGKEIIQPTKYFGIVENAYNTVFRQPTNKTIVLPT
ncbi:MAG TPA: hypothetical protein VF884_14885 [Nitrososphaeraceae archaeon]